MNCFNQLSKSVSFNFNTLFSCLFSITLIILNRKILNICRKEHYNNHTQFTAFVWYFFSFFFNSHIILSLWDADGLFTKQVSPSFIIFVSLAVPLYWGGGVRITLLFIDGDAPLSPKEQELSHDEVMGMYLSPFFVTCNKNKN